MSTPRTETISRTGAGTANPQDPTGPADWTALQEQLRRGESTCWLSVRGRDGGVHTRPLFAAWDGAAFVLTTNAGAAKARHLKVDGAVSLAMDLGTSHIVVEGRAERLTSTADLTRASRAMLDVYDWPTEVTGDELDAPYAAPTSGGPPFQAWQVTPERVFAFPTADEFEPTRFVFASGTSSGPRGGRAATVSRGRPG